MRRRDLLKAVPAVAVVAAIGFGEPESKAIERYDPVTQRYHVGEITIDRWERVA